MNSIEIIDEILSKKEDLSKEKILELIENRKSEFHGLLSEHGAALLVAQDLGVDINQDKIKPLEIDDLISDLNNVTITGRVLDVFPLRDFTKKNGSIGRYIRIILADNTGKILCVAWNSKATDLSKSELQGKIVKICNAYTKEGINGEIEIHIGDRSNVIISTEASEEDFPK